jgi:hypothetical protein
MRGGFKPSRRPSPAKVRTGRDTSRRRLSESQQLVVSAFLCHYTVFQHRILSQLRMVLNRCAIVITVLPLIRRSKASITALSDSVSRAAVGSSKIRIGLLRYPARF